MTQPRSAGFAFAFVLGLELALGFCPASAQDLAATPPPPIASAPTVLSSEPAPGTTVGSLREIEVLFDQPVSGVDAEDLLVNDLPASDVTEVAPGQYLFGFATPPRGTVTVRWSPLAGIVAADTPFTPFAGGSWSFTVDPAVARRRVTISEFMADNDVALYDDDCDRSDWIEIHNGGTDPVDLRGWSLTDDPAVPAKWSFPAYTLEAESYLVVFASQKNKTNLPPRACRTRPNSLAGFHTNFRLDPDGEYLALVAPDGEVISAFAPTYPPQRRDVSYGRAPGDEAAVGYLSRPTPRGPNADRGTGFAPEVRFSRNDGPFLQPFLLTLRTASDRAVIRFTTDGTFPAETNTRLATYTGPIPVTNTAQIRARAFEPGLLPGPPASRTFLRLTNDPAQLGSLTSTLPIVVITTLKSATIGASVNTPIHLSLFEPRKGRTTLLDQPTFSTRAGAKTRGSSTGGQPQSNFAVEWWDEFNQDRDHAVLGMPEHSEWVLYAPNEFDAALIHNPFTMELSRQMDFAAPRTRFVEVYLNKGGSVRSNDWFGLYVLMEKPGLSKGRIDLPKAQPEDLSPPEITGSYMFKTDRLDPGDSGLSAGGAVMAFVEPKEREMKSTQRAPQLAYLGQYFRNLDAALRPTNPNLRDPVLGYRGYLDVTNWIDFHLLELLSGQVDAIRLSTYFYKPRDGKLRYGPRWDYDRAWESKGDNRDDNPRIWDSGGGLFAGPWWNRVLGDRDAWQLWIDRWTHFRRSVFARENMFGVIDAMTNEIRSAQPRENRRWSATAPRSNYPNEIRIMKTWISNRLAWIDSQFAQPPLLSSGDARVAPGFQLTLSLPAVISNPTNVAIFYTLDGSDPRPVAGTSAPVAFRYSAPITVTTNTRVVARLRDNGRTQRGTPTSSPWSAPAIATFVVDPLPLRITELMFHPPPHASDPDGVLHDLQFVELANAGSSEIDLSGCAFVRGIDFRFSPTQAVHRLAPGQRLVLAADPAAFALRYPEVPRIAGPFQGNLSDAGERITLVGPAGETIADFAYTDEGFRAADGLGFSTVPVDEAAAAADPGDPKRWRVSSKPGGSPGREDPPPGPRPPAVRISEIMASPTRGDDWVEVFNPENVPADIGGWWLADGLDSLRRVRIPPGWIVPPGGYRVLPASVFDLPGSSGFRFDSQGDQVWLLSADADGSLTGWVHGFAFGGSPPGTSLGWVRTGSGADALAALEHPTEGLPNADADIGPLMIAGYAAQPTAAAATLGFDDGFVELRNVSPTPLPLVDPESPTDSWRLEGRVDFDFAHAFPFGRVLSPGERLILVGFDPALDADAAALFRALRRPPETVTLVGPWHGSGAADTTGTALRLLPPKASGGFDDSEVPPVGSESFAPAPTAPWPADGFLPGYALARRRPTEIADDPAHWVATMAAPGWADGDFDGLPDAWEVAHGLDPLQSAGIHGAAGDPDADGRSNATEYRGDGDPRAADAGSRVRALALARGRVVCLVAAEPGRTLTWEAFDPDGRNGWERVQTQVVPAEGLAVLTVDARPGTARLVRVREP